MDIYEMLKEHDSLYGSYIPMAELQSSRLGDELSSYSSKVIPILLQKLEKGSPTNQWGIQMSLHWKKQTVSRKSKRLLLQQLLDCHLLLQDSEVSEEVSIFLWMSIYFIYNDLLGKSPSPFFLRDKRERQLCGLALLLLKYGDWKFREGSNGVNWLQEIEASSLSGYKLSTLQILMSRSQTYFVGDWISFRLEVVSDPNTPGRGIPYSSYCKGYGMDRGRKVEGKTPISFELDGETELDKTMVLWKDHELATLFYLVEISTW